jgi:hypothetical protein
MKKTKKVKTPKSSPKVRKNRSVTKTPITPPSIFKKSPTTINPDNKTITGWRPNRDFEDDPENELKNIPNQSGRKR